MPTYVPREIEVEAHLWEGHDAIYDFDVEVYKTQGVTGYAAKLGCVMTEKNEPLVVRPNDYVIKSGEKISTMTKKAFEEKYELLKNPKKSREKVASKEKLSDNNNDLDTSPI